MSTTQPDVFVLSDSQFVYVISFLNSFTLIAALEESVVHLTEEKDRQAKQCNRQGKLLKRKLEGLGAQDIKKRNKITRLETQNEEHGQQLTRLESQNEEQGQQITRLETQDEEQGQQITRLETQNGKLEQQNTKLETEKELTKLQITQLMNCLGKNTELQQGQGHNIEGVLVLLDQFI